MAQNSKNTGKKRKRANVLTIVLLIVAVVVIIFALWRLLPILMDYRQSNSTYEELAEEVVDQTGTVEGEIGSESWNAYDWQSVEIDFNALWQINSDVVGWIRFDNTDAVTVDYPILHGETNDDYLHTDLYGTYHYAGSVFLESGNSADLTDIYNIIYGHNMRNGSMFGTLRRYRDSDDFYEENPYFTISTPRGAFRYEIFGYANISDSSDIYRVGFMANNSEYQELIDEMLSVSMRDTGIVPTAKQQTVTLSTCTSAGDTYRFAVFGVCVDQVLY